MVGSVLASYITIYDYIPLQVADGLVQKFNRVAEVIPVIVTYTEKVSTQMIG